MGQSFARLASLAEQVRVAGACSLPGCSFDYSVFMPIMQRAVIRGFVPLASAQFVAEGLRYGFKCGVDASQMRGKRVYRNYPTAYAAADKVSEAVSKRVSAHKTLCLGEFDVSRKGEIPLDTFAVFPMGAVVKKLESAMRPVDDHTRTLLNKCTDLTNLRFTLRTHDEVAALLKRTYSMAVKDVSDAFPLVPLHPSLWPFMLFQWWSVDSDDPYTWCLYVHLFAGFGMAGLPGVWKILFQDVLLGMARSERHISLPVPVFVDDAAIIGADGKRVDEEAKALALFLLSLGVVMKEIKTRYASMVQLYIGLWWDSVHRTLELEESKRESYLAAFDAMVASRSMTLREAQSLAGRMQRASLTFPPGSFCVFSSLFAFTRGLVLPWQKRRVPSGLRADVKWGAEMLRANLGRGYFSYDEFSTAPKVWTDASKAPRYTGGGYVVATGEYCYFRYGTSAARKPIDELEGDVVVLMAEQCGGAHWAKCIVPVHVDNQAFQRSGVKGWSKAERLNDLLKRLFRYAVAFECVFIMHWISTHDNVLADALSRQGAPATFLAHPRLRELISREAALRPHRHSGRVRHWGKGFSSSTDGDGPSRGGPSAQVLSVSYSRTSIYVGLPDERTASAVDAIIDNRLGQSSHASIRAALGHWDVVRARHGWARILESDSVTRGGRMAAFVVFLVDETDLVYSSIENYVWALRTWMKFQRQLDPVFGVMEWADFMAGVEVKTFVPAEPRKEVPGSWIVGACTHADRSVFWEVQAVLLQLILLYTFARSESPLAQAQTGERQFDPLKNLQVCDVQVKMVQGVRSVGVRLKAIKQDPRMQRVEARGDGDWVWIGQSEGVCDVVMWLQLYFSFFAGIQRRPSAPFFLAGDTGPRDLERVLTYSKGMEHVRALWARTPGVTAEMSKQCGLHGLRVAGNNGVTRTLGKEVARAQGGWAGEETRSRYDRVDLADVVTIPTAIARSWAARESEFDFSAVSPPEAQAARPSSVPLLPALRRPVEGAAVEREVARPRAGSRSVRTSHPYSRPGAQAHSSSPREASASRPPAAQAAARAEAASTSALQTHGPVRPAPAPPAHVSAQRRDEASQHLSLTRPVRAARLAPIARLPAGLRGDWSSSLS